MLKSATALLLAALAASASAQTLQSAKVEPSPAKPGEPVTVTASFDVSKGLNCNVRFHFGDGAFVDQKVNQEKDATLSVQHTYAKAGSYEVKVQPRIALPALKCLGGDQVVKLVVAAPAPAAKPAAAAPTCPGGWTLQAKSVNKKTGAYTCGAKAGTAAPAARPACPGSLTYFENTKKGQLGCRP